jgi:hypothetical protein
MEPKALGEAKSMLERGVAELKVDPAFARVKFNWRDEAA